jgi:hypothetical protein
MAAIERYLALTQQQRSNASDVKGVLAGLATDGEPRELVYTSFTDFSAQLRHRHCSLHCGRRPSVASSTISASRPGRMMVRSAMQHITLHLIVLAVSLAALQALKLLGRVGPGSEDIGADKVCDQP